jgi:glycosyltransferase involved in cell wall biosynthesis
MTSPDVSVVIPTAGRSSVLAAVASALDQTHAPLEVIVVIDSKDSSISSAVSRLSSAVRVFFTGGIGANGARMRGVAEAKGEIIAFLDDDDVWAPEKIERQLALWRNRLDGRCYALVSCRIAVINASGRVQRILPSRLLGKQERVAEYLFRRTSIAYGEGLLHTSTLMCDRALIEMEPWDLSLSRHQDWDWVLRVDRRSDVIFHMCPDVLVGVAAADTRSISMSHDWHASLMWVEQRADQLTARERGDFLLCHTGPIAIRAGSRRGGLIAASRALRSGRPCFTAWLVWGLHMLSPRLVDRASALSRSLSSGPRATWRDTPGPD